MSACAWEKQLLIPLINEVFHLSISEDAEIANLSPLSYSVESDSDQYEKLIKRITDALIRVNNNIYHFECESKNDGMILIRLAEYDMKIGLNDLTYTDYKVRVKLPLSAVVFVRNHRKLPPYGEIEYELHNQSIKVKIPFIKVAKYKLEELVEKHLFILFPFYLMRYEHALKSNLRSKDAIIENEASRVYNELTLAYENKLISKKTYENLLTLCNDVLKEISKKNHNKERLVTIMGTGVLLTMEERGMENGKEEARLESIRSALKNSNMTFEEVCKLLGITEPEKYRNLL